MPSHNPQHPAADLNTVSSRLARTAGDRRPPAAQPRRLYRPRHRGQGVRRPQRQVHAPHRPKRNPYEPTPCPRPPGDLENIVALLAAFRADPQEHLWVFALDASEPPCIASVDLVSKGHHNTQVVTAAEILRPVIVSGCNRFVLAHNHPIDSALPTAQDIAFTGRSETWRVSWGWNCLTT